MRKLRCRAEIDRQVLGAVPAPLATAAFSLLLDIRLLLLDVASVHVAVDLISATRTCVTYFLRQYKLSLFVTPFQLYPNASSAPKGQDVKRCQGRGAKEEEEEEREDAEADVEEEEEGEAWWWW